MAGSFSIVAETVKGRLAMLGEVSLVKGSPGLRLNSFLGEALAFLFLFQEPKGTTPRSLAQVSYWAVMVLTRSGCLGGEVVHFGAVGGDVVEFPLTFDAFGDEFPFTIADGAVAFVLEEDGFAALDGASFESGNEGSAFDRDFRAWIGRFSRGRGRWP